MSPIPSDSAYTFAFGHKYFPWPVNTARDLKLTEQYAHPIMAQRRGY